MLHRPNWYTRRGITLHSGDPDRRDRPQATHGALAERRRWRPTTGCCIATGSDPIVLPLPGKDLPGVVTFRDLDDVDAMLERSGAGRRAVVIGGGLLGLEAAHGLAPARHARHRGAPARHADGAPARRAGRRAAQGGAGEARHRIPHAREDRRRSSATIASRGVQFDDGERSRRGPRGHGRRRAARTSSSRKKADLRLRPRHPRRRHAADLRPGIYAVGECVQHRRQTFGLVAPLWEQARICAQHIAEIGVSRFSGAVNCHAAQGDRHRSVLRRRFLGAGRTASRWCSRTSAAASTSAWCSRATRCAAPCCSATCARRRACAT